MLCLDFIKIFQLRLWFSVIRRAKLLNARPLSGFLLALVIGSSMRVKVVYLVLDFSLYEDLPIPHLGRFLHFDDNGRCENATKQGV